ncbi:hypothetical protein LOZ12_004694 [Ophidiomyces ophidiicola]|uniref:Uncharacterized protein n=1 Tax=Ophidiomyces ophidiicola TaxID=1387563 RepID=A0ACB8USH2_9EURO|nr:uncharacterized protein LOZ57_006518 [Ophidiomyces ophidiicola]KAI1910329.1 hypothetical protein LOZ64_005004 [Ophidiomyces ophidiicola]KAI1937837.1 hypothetical protein LOZ57_006518 [Ophidiomyces ophidiicola]KAI1942371.1 hypothetical protein LOZ62_004592 [Ophidiomyces ophidiicola]KAI1973372.1 hypothetical protein LOZ55_005451 [Ophidiomyces ophidiicola]KAI1988656.1 hypothetical protein LOZ51_005473 [Ophidiomyces ophidiicola]
MGSYEADSSRCFTLLAQKLPSWLTRVSDLAAHTTAKQEEFKADYTKYARKDRKSRMRKGSSLHTNRPDLEGSSHSLKSSSGSGTSQIDSLTRMKLLKPGDINQKKRIDDCSGSPNDTDRHLRPRRQFIIHYDCQTQTALEKLVREIGGARNHIRKGRMVYMMKSSMEMKPLPEGFPPDDAMKPIFRSTRQITRPLPGAKNSPFDLADTYLENAQALCEAAAHQFLRSGDCSKELDRTRQKLKLALDLAEIETEIEAEAEAKAEMKAKVKATEKEKEKGKEAGKEVEFEKLTSDVDIKATIPGKDLDAPRPAIEVDDASDVSSISIDITAFRASRFKR